MSLRRTFGYGAAWLAATAAGVAVSWLGVRDVLRHSVLEPTNVVPAAQVAAPKPVTGTPPAPPTTTTTPPTTTARASTPTPTTSARPSAPAGDVRAYDVAGGRVVLSLGQDSARLVSATPKPGYQVKTAENAQWLRVDLVSGEHGSAVFATWNNHPPLVDIYEY